MPGCRGCERTWATRIEREGEAAGWITGVSAAYGAEAERVLNESGHLAVLLV